MIFKNLLLSYQLENYYNLRFLRFIYTHPKFWIYWSQRQVLEYTSKAKLILFIALIILSLDIFFSFYLLSGFILIISLVSIAFILPFYFIIANILISPLDAFLKNKIVSKAKHKLSEQRNLQVIAITWSYWKTTTKEILHTILSESFNVLSTEWTKNTPLWVSRLILEKLTNSHEVLIVEMWAYTKWNIAELCNIVWPNISIITGITLQHLERFKSLDNIIDAKFEILEYLWANDLAIVDTSSAWVQKWLKEKKLDVRNIIQIQKQLPYKYLDNLSGIEFDFQWEKIKTKLLADYIGNTIQICYHISKNLGQSIESFKKWVQKIDFVDHRMQLIYNPSANIFVLDDSFNGNLEWINTIIKLLKWAPFAWKKIMVAWWIVELWEKLESENKNIWEKLSKVCDTVLLVAGPVWNAIEFWLLDTWFLKENIKKYNSSLELHSDIKNNVSHWDLIVFQNDLPDNYL